MPLLYFVLTLFISWGGMLLVVGFAIPGTSADVQARLPMVVLAILAGPPLAALLSAGAFEGRAGIGNLFRQLKGPRVPARWYVAVLLGAPVVMAALYASLSLFWPIYLPALLTIGEPAAVIRFGVIVAIAAGLFEEFGWTGYAIPRLLPRYGVLKTGVIVGLVWALWHVLPALWLSGSVSGTYVTLSYTLDPFLFLVMYRILMVWVYDRTRSLPVAMVMHGSLTASARILGPAAISGWALIAFDTLWAVVTMMAVLWLMPRRASAAHQAPSGLPGTRPLAP